MVNELKIAKEYLEKYNCACEEETGEFIEYWKTKIEEHLSHCKRELERTERLVKWICSEIVIAEKANTNNGKQSIIIYHMVLGQLNPIIKDLQSAIKTYEEKK